MVNDKTRPSPIIDQAKKLNLKQINRNEFPLEKCFINWGWRPTSKDGHLVPNDVLDDVSDVLDVVENLD